MMGAPRITINGVLPCSGREGQIWPFQSGATSPVVPLLVHAELDEQLQGLEAPISLSIEGTHRTPAGKEDQSITISQLFLVKRESIERGHRVRWTIADIRWFLSQLWVFAEFSARRQLNEFLEFGLGAQRDFHRTPKMAYIPHTQRDVNSPFDDPVFSSGAVDPENHRPWTARQAVFYMLKGWFRQDPFRVGAPGLPPDWRPTVIDATNGADNDRLLADHSANKPWPVVMNDLLKMAHLGLYVNHEGAFVVYSLDPRALEDGVGGYTGGGVPIRQDASRARPHRVRVYFRREQEIRFNYIESSAQRSGTVERGRRDVSLDLENVLILPQKVREVSTGKTYQRGSFVSIEKALELWNQDPDNPPPQLLTADGKKGERIKFSLDFVRKNILSPALATKMTLLPRFLNANDNLFAARASTLYNSFRQQFRIPAVWLDLIDDIRAERTAIMDPITGKRQPSPVYMDYFTEFSARYFHYKGSPKKDLKAGVNVRAWDGDLAQVADAEKLPLDRAQVAPADISFVNKKQGVFRVSFITDLEGNTENYYHTVFADDKVPITLLGGVARTWLLSQSEYDPLWRMSTILSATLRTPNDRRKMFAIQFDKRSTPSVDADASGPAQEILYTGTHAGIGWLDADQTDSMGRVLNHRSIAQNVEFNGQDSVEISGGVLTNPRVIQDAAEAQLKDVQFKTADRVIGSFAQPGINEQPGPYGQVTTVTIKHANGRLETLHNATAPPVPPPFWELLPASSQRFLFRMEGADTE